MDLSVVIVNHNRKDDLREALKSVETQDHQPVETIIVDNASTDGSLDMLVREFPNVAVVPLSENTGMDGYSEGFRRARGGIIFQMDNDSFMPDGQVLSEIVARFRAAPSGVAVIASRVEEYRPGDSVEEIRGRDTRRGPINTGGFHAGGVAFRRSALDKVGHYNRDVFLYGAELFLQMKFLAAGYAIHYYPEILMLHRSSGVARSREGVYYELRNRYWFMRVFATPGQRLRRLPAMFLHDSVYALWKRRIPQFIRAFRDGFGELPPSLAPVVSRKSEFVGKVEEVSAEFSLKSLARRALQVLRVGRETRRSE